MYYNQLTINERINAKSHRKHELIIRWAKYATVFVYGYDKPSFFKILK